MWARIYLDDHFFNSGGTDILEASGKCFRRQFRFSGTVLEQPDETDSSGFLPRIRRTSEFRLPAVQPQPELELDAADGHRRRGLHLAEADAGADGDEPADEAGGERVPAGGAAPSR